MKIALCYPRTKKDARGLSAMPIGILIIGTILKNKGYEIKIFDASFDDNIESVFKKITEFDPELVGISLLTPFYNEGAELTKLCKEKGYITVWGGPHPTVESLQSLRDNPGLDFIVMGEGEKTFPDLLKNLKTPEKVKGIGYKKDKKIILTPAQECLNGKELETIPNRGLLETLPAYLDSKIINIIVYRGCPFNCAFCQPTLRKLFGNGWRMRSPENVIEELKILKQKYNPNHFLFSDDTFTANHEWVRKFVSLIKKENLKIKFEISTRVNENIFTEEMAELLKSVGLYKISFGVESGNQKILDNLRKNITLRETRNAFKICAKYGIETHAFIILGSIGETKETLADTEKFLEEIKPTTINISVATPQPGTDLYSKCKELNLLNLKDSRQSDYYAWEFKILPIKNEDITFDDVLKTKKSIIKKRRLKFILYNLKREIKHPSIKRFIYLAKEFKKRKDKG